MLTVLLATRNGARTLPRVLEAFVCLQAPRGGWKLVVIDNASTDQTSAIVHSFRERLPLTYTFEENLGKNFALNSGLAHLEGDLAVFTDDDVFPKTDWLIRLQAAAEIERSYAIFGGVVLPHWELYPPNWVSWAPTTVAFALTDPRWENGPTRPEFILGPNMAVRVEIFRAGYRFDSTIGPRGGDYAMGSETEFVLRLARQGHKAWHVRDAIVEHFVRSYQLQKSWVLGRAVRYGRGCFRIEKIASPAAHPYIFEILVRLLLKMGKLSLKIVKAWLCANEQGLFYGFWHLYYHYGCMKEAIIWRDQR